MSQHRAYIKTFGCQLNEHDSLAMQGILGGMGYAGADAAEEADIVLFNTCTIRDKAQHKAISELGRAGLLKRQHPGMIVGLCGCVAQQLGAGLMSRFPEVDFAFGPDQIWRLPELIARALAGERPVALALVDDPASYRFVEPVAPQDSPQAFVQVMKGCNGACSYCIVPSVRGREVSRPGDEIVRDVQRLAGQGVREITLLGQNVCAYQGRGGGGLARLIRRIAAESAVERIRFTSPHPRDIGGELIACFAEVEKLCPHLHLPAQSGSDEVLRRMRRGYTAQRYLEVTRRLREARPGLSVTTDLIVGFCGERPEDFEATLELVEEVPFDAAFAFMYSPRPGTEAAREFPDDVPQQEKEARLDRLLQLQRMISRERNAALLGREGEVLVTGTDRMGRGLLTGRLPDNRICHFAGQTNRVGCTVRVRITGHNDHSVEGEAIP